MNHFSNDKVPNPLRLLNEWRDTAGVVTLAVAAAAQVISPKAACSVWVYRELARGMCWALGAPPPQIAGAPRNPDSTQVAFAAVAVGAMGSLALKFIGFEDSTLWNGVVDVMAGALFTVRAGGFKGVKGMYERVWDWPRKGGGPTETSKLTNIIKSFAPIPKSALPNPATRVTAVARHAAPANDLS